MPVEEIVSEIRKQEKIINDAQKAKETLYQKLLDSGTEDFEVISVKEASRILNVSLGTVYNKISKGELRTRHIGTSVRVFKSDILKIDDRRM